MTKINTAKTNLLHNIGLDRDILATELLKLNKKGVDFADFYLQQIASESWVVDENIVKSGSYAFNQGVGLRAICGDKSFFTFTNAFDAKMIRMITNDLFVEKSNKKLSASLIEDGNSYKPHNLYTEDNPLTTMQNIDKISMLQKINQLGRQKPYVTNVIASLNLEYDQMYLLRSDNIESGDIRPLVHLSVSVILEKNSKKESGSSGGGGRYTLAYYTDEVITNYLEKAYAQAMSKLDAVESPRGEMPVVLGSGFAGVILHEAVGHGLEGDFNRRNSSAFCGKIGTQVASKGVTIIDDGTIVNRRGSLNVDDEGNPTQRTVLIEDGILQGFLYDELNARLMNTKSTGNGRRESFASNLIPRMTNTFMLNGDHSYDEIIASVDNGIYADTFEGGQVDITSGSFVFNASVAWKIENGKLAYPIKGCALVGNGPECLKHVSMIGNNSVLDSGVGTCGKEGQGVPVGVGQPTFRLDGGLIVGG